jgi:hypothetical protein
MSSVILPENFSADEILTPLKLRKDLHSNLKAGMYFILDNLLKMSQSRKWRDYFDVHAGYPLHSSILNHIIGKNYTKVIELLVDSGIIRRTQSYQAGHQSKLYTLTEKYASARIEFRNIPKNAALLVRISQYEQNEKENNKVALAKIPHITKWFDPKRLTINPKKAHALIEFYMTEARTMIPSPLPKGRTEEEIEARINHRVNSMLDTLASLQRGYMGLKKTGLDNRLHSIVSSTKKELRSLYIYDGKPMVSIDLKSSQPYLLTQLLNPKNWGEKGLISKLYPQLYSVISKSKFQKLLNTILMFGGFSKSQAGKGFRQTGFYKFPWNTDFYQTLVDRAGAEGRSKIFPNRASAKKKMMMILFDDGVYMDKDPGFNLFRKWYPEEAELISLLKQVSRESKVTSDDESANFLPITLQRLESYLMLEKVCKQIAKELPDAPLIPIHDCIMTTPAFASKVKEIAVQVLEKITGISPGVTVEKGTTSLKKQKVLELAANDVAEILEKRPKGKHFSTKLKVPVLFKPPDIGGDWLIHSRYAEESVNDPSEIIIHLVDDIK